jgi:hypothetical protein
LHSVRTGETAFDRVHGVSFFEYLSAHPEAAEVFNANMTSMTAQEAQSIVTAYDFSGAGPVVDIGGGHGALVEAVLRSQPSTRAVIFDLPSVTTGTRARLEEAGLANRCELTSGSFLDFVPGDGGIYILKDIIHDWDDEQARVILRNCYLAMKKSAKLLIVERIVPPGNDPSTGKLIDINMLVLTGGMERTEAQYRNLLESSGFCVRNIIPTGIDTSIVEAVPD